MSQRLLVRDVKKPVGYRVASGMFISPAQTKIINKQPAQFATAIAHEIRNPLSSISLAAEMLKESIIMDAEQKLYLDIIIRGIGRIDNLVYDLLTYYQEDKLQFEKHSIHDLLDKVLEMTEDRGTCLPLSFNKVQY